MDSWVHAPRTHLKAQIMNFVCNVLKTIREFVLVLHGRTGLRVAGVGLPAYRGVFTLQSCTHTINGTHNRPQAHLQTSRRVQDGH